MTSILHLSRSDAGGGAAIAAYRLHDGLKRIGVSSRMLVTDGHRSEPEITVAVSSSSVRTRILRRWLAARQAADMAPHRDTIQSTLELFSDDRALSSEVRDGTAGADLINLHWVSGAIDHRRFFGRLDPLTPLVWTLHDMNPMTGGCHYSLGCRRYEHGCGACPQLGSRHHKDVSAQIHNRKSEALMRLSSETTCIITPSRWLGDEAQRSSLLSRFQILHIPNGVDVNVFRPRSRAAARDMFDLPQEAMVLLFMADHITNYRKGFDLLQEALRDLQTDHPLICAAIGHLDEPRANITSLGRIDDERMLSFALSAADVFVLPTRADNLPNVLLESMACGTPMVSFDVGGVSEAVRPGVTGLLAPAEDVASLRKSIELVLKDDSFRQTLANKSRQVAVSEYSVEVQARRYSKAYETLIDTSLHLKRKRIKGICATY